MRVFTTKEIGDRVGGILEGSGDIKITGVEDIQRASSEQLTFIGSRQYAAKWAASKAGAALVKTGLSVDAVAGRTVIRVANPELALTTVLSMFAPSEAHPAPGIDARAAVDPSAKIGGGVAIGALSAIGARSSIGDGTVIHQNVTIFNEVSIGAKCVLWPGVVVRERCIIGDGCILHPNVSIGADGFGYTPGADGKSIVKIPHIGIVRLGKGVELGASTCVDRAKFSETVIGDGTKIDNLCQIGHNTRIGRGTLIVSLCGIGGSVTIGDGVLIGGGCSIKDHVTIGDGARLGGSSALMHDIPAGESWVGMPAKEATAAFREYAAIPKLPELLRQLKQMQRAEADTDTD